MGPTAPTGMWSKREGNRQREWLRDVGREGVGGVKKGEGDWMKTGQYLTLQF